MKTKASDGLIYLVISLAGIVGIGLLYFFNPSVSVIFPPCPTEALTHYYCPGCGSLRAMHALLHGDIKEAFSQNLMAVIFLPILPLMYFRPKWFSNPILPIAILIIFVAFTILRNTQAFCFLAPH